MTEEETWFEPICVCGEVTSKPGTLCAQCTTERKERLLVSLDIHAGED